MSEALFANPRDRVAAALSATDTFRAHFDTRLARKVADHFGSINDAVSLELILRLAQDVVWEMEEEGAR